MHVLQKSWQIRTWHHIALAALLCMAVILVNILAGLLVVKWFFSFWLCVALYSFTPVWLVCFGLLFSPRWRWHELAAGVALAVFLLNLTYLHDSTDTPYKWLSSVVFALCGACAVSSGVAMSTLGRSVRKMRLFHSHTHLKG